MHDLSAPAAVPAKEPVAEPVPASPPAQTPGRAPSRRRSSLQRWAITLAPLLGLVILFAVFLVVATSRGVNLSYSLTTLVNQSVIVIVIATGAIFIFAMGSFDISLGASTLVAAMAGALAFNATANLWAMLLVCIATAVVTSLISATLAAVFDLPVFVTTIAMLSVLGAVALSLVQTTGGAQIRIDPAVARTYDTLGVKLLVAAAFIALCVLLFNYTRLGRVEKLIGGNPVNARLTGVSVKWTAVAAFAIAGLGVGLGAFLTVLRTPTLTTTTASDIGMNVLVAMVFGGMPISGGPRSRIYAAVVGGLSMALLNQTMTTLLATSSAGNGVAQIVRAVCFLGVVWLAAASQRSPVLPR